MVGREAVGEPTASYLESENQKPECLNSDTLFLTTRITEMLQVLRRPS